MIVSPDITGNMDGSVLRIAEHTPSPVPIVPITRIEGFQFNPDLLSLDKYILLDYSELWWNSENTDTHIFGKNTTDFPEIFKGDEWKKFDDFIAKKPPLIYFKRELFKKDVSETVLPIDYPCWTNPYPVDTKEMFNARPIQVFNFWGRSHEARVKLHSDIWKQSSHNGASVCDNIYQLNDFLRDEKNPNKWVTMYMPHYHRIQITDILSYNGISKLSMSLKGSGMKCFRHAESPTNSVMIMNNDDLAWAYPWEDGINCIKMKGEPVDEIEKALKRTDLHDLYLNSMETIDKYRIENYVKNYLKPLTDNL